MGGGLVDWVDFLSIISWPWLAKIWAIKITWELQKSLSVGGWVDFLIIVSAPGPGWQRFGYIKYLGAPEKFVGGWGGWTFYL